MSQESQPDRGRLESVDETSVGDSLPVLPVLPVLSGRPDDETLAEWLRVTLPKTCKQSRYARDLARALARYEFREDRLHGPKGRKR